MDKLKVVKSSLIQAYSYDPATKTLDVVFKDGTELTYKDIDPPTMSQVFDRSPSVGRAFHRLIRGKYKSSPTQE